MKANTDTVILIGCTYKLWAQSHRTQVWTALGKTLDTLSISHGWPSVQQLLADELRDIPMQHFKLALADYRASKTIDSITPSTAERR